MSEQEQRERSYGLKTWRVRFKFEHAPTKAQVGTAIVKIMQELKSLGIGAEYMTCEAEENIEAEAKAVPGRILP